MASCTPLTLLDELVSGLSEHMGAFPLKNVRGQEMGLNIYAQDLPVKQVRDDVNHFPFLLVNLDEILAGHERVVRILFVAGVHDLAPDKQGFRDVINLLERVYQFIAGRPFVGGFSLSLDKPIKTYLVDSQDFGPQYFGVMEAIWEGAVYVGIDD